VKGPGTNLIDLLLAAATYSKMLQKRIEETESYKLTTELLKNVEEGFTS
jgi:hypothetical protein